MLDYRNLSMTTTRAPIRDVNGPPVKETSLTTHSYQPTSTKARKKYYRLLIPILGAVVAGIIGTCNWQ